MKKILFVFGTRPEAIKLAPLINQFKTDKDFKIIVCITAQHREMLDQIINIFDITPDYDFNLMKNNQNLFDISIGVLNKINPILAKERPDYMFIQGDTTTAFIAALAAFYYKIPVYHIEAGLRTNNIYNPWPEEINRQLISRIATIHFAPTENSKLNLIKENINEERIFVTGNTGIDSLLYTKKKITTSYELESKIKKNLVEIGYGNINSNRKIILITGHRRESFGEKLENVCSAIKKLADKFEDIDFIYPVHLNPNVQKPVFEIIGNVENIFLLPPLDYLCFVYLITRSYIIITDSGGIQEEAPSLKKPVLVIRELTERTEGVDAGTLKVIGTDTSAIIDYTSKLINSEIEYSKMTASKNPFGDGMASVRVVSFMQKIKP